MRPGLCVCLAFGVASLAWVVVDGLCTATPSLLLRKTWAVTRYARAAGHIAHRHCTSAKPLRR